MKASISFPEIQNIVAEKAKQTISFGHVDAKTLKVTYPLNLGFMKKDISANLTILEMVGSDLLVGVDAGFATDKLLTTVLNLLKDKIPAGLIEKRPESRLMLHLGSIEQLQALFEKIDVNDIRVLAEGLEVEGTLSHTKENN